MRGMTTTRRLIPLLAAILTIGVSSPALAVTRLAADDISIYDGPVIERTHVMEAEAGSTGDGPANDEDCQAFANIINRLIAEGQDFISQAKAGYDVGGTAAEFTADYAAAIDTVENAANDVGCFVVY
jgi:hypothetical protein